MIGDAARSRGRTDWCRRGYSHRGERSNLLTCAARASGELFLVAATFGAAVGGGGRGDGVPSRGGPRKGQGPLQGTAQTSRGARGAMVHGPRNRTARSTPRPSSRHHLDMHSSIASQSRRVASGVECERQRACSGAPCGAAVAHPSRSTMAPWQRNGSRVPHETSASTMTPCWVAWKTSSVEDELGVGLRGRQAQGVHGYSYEKMVHFTHSSRGRGARLAFKSDLKLLDRRLSCFVPALAPRSRRRGVGRHCWVGLGLSGEERSNTWLAPPTNAARHLAWAVATRSIACCVNPCSRDTISRCRRVGAPRSAWVAAASMACSIVFGVFRIAHSVSHSRMVDDARVSFSDGVPVVAVGGQAVEIGRCS